MGTRILGFIVAVLIVFGIYSLYEHYKQDKVLDSGAVTCVGCMTPEQKAAYDKEDHGDTADGQSEHKTQTARQAAVEAVAPTQTPTPAPRLDVAQSPAREPLPQRVSTDVARIETHAGSDTAAMQAGAPAYDTAAPNAPNGVRFGGSGMYQWYRQGNLTWRVDTASGRSCIVYATMEEWRKQIVLSHGCGREG